MATPPEQLDERLLNFERSIRASNARFDRAFAQCDYADERHSVYVRYFIDTENALAVLDAARKEE